MCVCCSARQWRGLLQIAVTSGFLTRARSVLTFSNKKTLM